MNKNDYYPIWHPFTQMKTAPIPFKVSSGKGIYLELEDGRRVIDGISSWWVNIHGHSHPKIAEAIYQQALQLEHVIFTRFTHDPAEKLSHALLNLLPPNLSKVFFSDNGSTAVEVALKQAYQYWINKGQSHRKCFLCFEGGYHGDTLGSMSLGERSIFTHSLRELLFNVTFAPYPETFWNDKEIEEKESRALAFIEKELTKEPRSYAAVVIEPLIQGAGGMRMCRPIFLRQLQQIAQQTDTFLIYDEVMTGFGRTGDWFASTKSQTQPDIICLSKGLTGGALPLAVTICTDKIYDAFFCDDIKKALFHSHSYTANPLGCAAALASLELLQQTQHLFKNMALWHQPHLEKLQKNCSFERIRVCGTIVAVDIVTSEKKGYLNSIGAQMAEKCLDRGVFLRPLGNTLYLMTPYCITQEELSFVYQTIEDVM